MITILVIGAGGIGMRHMQSIASLKEPFQCWAIDPSQSALDKVKALLDTMDTAASFRYITSQNDAPEAADVCIAVSYTHLDVYKRQGFRDAEESAAARGGLGIPFLHNR